MGFTPQALLAELRRLAGGADHPLPPRLVVALSGGLDSTVLFHALAALRAQLAPSQVTMFHVDHSLQSESRGWAAECLALARRWGIPGHSVVVDARPAAGESPEAAARRARYQALRQALEPGDWLLTAQHRDDQAETVLLQLMRGAGPRGLAAMPAIKPFGAGYLVRPLLGFSRAQLLAYARQGALAWTEDPTNQALAYDRNFLRHQIMPTLGARWPGVAGTLARAARQAAAAAEVLDSVAAEDLEAAAGPAAHVLSVSRLRALPAARQGNALVVWLRRLGLPAPAAVHVDEVMAQLAAEADRMPKITWGGAEVRRYRDGLYAMAPLTDPPGESLAWDPRQALDVAGLGRLEAVPVSGRGLALARLDNQPLMVRFGHQGLRCRPAGRGGSHSLKKLFQESGVPPWQRVRTPLVFAAGRLAAVPGLCVDESWAAGPGAAGLALRWRPAPGKKQSRCD